MNSVRNQQILLKIYGDVHGVGYRYHAQKQAQRLGLVGWVRNEPDGTVTITAQGDRSKLEELVNWCRQGSPAAKVNDLEIIWSEPHEQFRQFEIRY